MNNVTICFYLQDGVEILDFAGPMEVFAVAGFKVITVSKYKTNITTQGILKFQTDYNLDDAPEASILAFFGGNYAKASNDPDVIDWIHSRKLKTDYYFSVCTGAFFLGNAGLLDNRSVTTFHKCTQALQSMFPLSFVLTNKRFVEDENILTTAGVSAGIDGALHLVSKIKGIEAARQVVEYMEYDRWKPDDGLIMSSNCKETTLSEIILPIN